MKRIDSSMRPPPRRRFSPIDTRNLKRLADKGRAASAGWWKEFTADPQVLPPYARPLTWRGRLLWAAVIPTLFVLCFVYGFFFALTAPYLIVQCAIPIVLLGMLSIWALPDERVAPTRLMRFLFTGFMIALCLWPRYLAVSLPGLPWITPTRLFGIPLALCLLISLSISGRFRRQLVAVLGATPIVWKALAVFTAMQFLTLPLSKSPASTLNRAIMQQVDWTTIFIFSVYMFSRPGRISRYIALLASMVVPIFIVAQLEYNQQHLLWMEYVPSFLAIEDIDLSPVFRLGTGEYRAKGVFGTALGLAQFMSIFTPFCIHYLHTSKRIHVKIISACLISMMYLGIEYSGSRLGLVGMLWSVLLYVFMHVFIRWKTFRHDLLAPALFYSYPAFFIVVMTASFTINSVHDSIWGGGAQAGSNQARINQIGMALPSIAKNPIGYGAGGSGDAMGYAAGRFVTIDNYLITVALEYGVIGLGAYLCAFIAATSYCFRAAVRHQWSKEPEAFYLIPLGVAISAFLVIKLVFSQNDNDPLLYALTGMAVALVARVNRAASRPTAPDLAPLEAQPTRTVKSPRVIAQLKR